MNSPQTVSVPSRAWFGDSDRTLTFPAGWDIHVCACEDAPALDSTQIAAAFDNPIGAAAHPRCCQRTCQRRHCR